MTLACLKSTPNQPVQMSYMGSCKISSLCAGPVSLLEASKAIFILEIPEYSSRCSAHADTDGAKNRARSVPPHLSIMHAPKSSLFPADHNDFPYPAQQRAFKGSLYHHCQLFPATCKNPFHYCWLLAALTMWEGFAASTLLSPLPLDPCTSAPRCSFCFALPSSCFLFKVKIDLCPAGAGKFP